MNTTTNIRTLAAGFAVLLAGCTATPPASAPVPDPAQDMGLRWVKYAAEYDALTRQAYAAATRDLPGFVADRDWSALPGQENAADKPPAVILDVDETVVSNVNFQLSFERPFDNWKLNAWTDATPATPIAGVKAFVEAARAAGVTVFFVTNRPCELIEGVDDPCPQKAVTVQDIAEVGIETDADHVFLSEERGWTREKLSRRAHLAETHRIIMLFGDDLGDFVPCIRSKVHVPCEDAATAEYRHASIERYGDYWGHGWYVFPNPMHGSWTSFDDP